MTAGCQQHVGTNYDKTYAHVAKWDTLQTTIIVVAHRGWPILHMDVTTAYLNNLLENNITTKGTN